jgi:hypothetical protein
MTTYRSDSFVQSIGVNQHLNCGGTVYANEPLELQELQYLGVSHVRDSFPQTWRMSEYDALAKAGIKSDFLLGATPGDISTNLSSELAAIDQLAQATPGSVDFVEAPNELNGQIVYLNGAASSDPSVGAAIMRTDSQAFRSDQLLLSQGVKLLNVSITNGPAGWSDYVTGLGNLSQYVDYANWHVYFDNGSQPLSHVTSMYQDALRSAPGKPVVFTETGYFTAYGNGSGVDEATQAKNTLNLLADAFKAGVQRSYLYELMEGTANPSNTDVEATFGLFRADGTAKPVATAIRNLTSILSDTAGNAATFAVGTLNYSITNLPNTGNSILMQKANGAFQLMVWNEAPDWNSSSKTEIQVAPTNSTVQLGGTYQKVEIFDPMKGSSAIQTLTNVSSVTLGLTDHPMIIQVDPQGAPPPPPIPSANGTTITSASDKPIIDQSGNSWSLVQSANNVGLQIAVNGSVDQATMFVTKLEILDGAMLQSNKDNLWWSEPGPNGPWTAISPPGGGVAGVTTGSGSDTLVLSISEDAYQGDAQFTVSVDGRQLGGTFAATALHSAGASQSFTFKGDWAVGAHTVAVNFLNDAYAGTPSADRNLYVNGVSYDGANTNQSAALMGGGPRSFTAADTTANPCAAVTVGTGSDTLMLSVSEDAYQGDAKFTVSVDGKQLAGTFTAAAQHSTGATQNVTFKGDWAPGTHALAVNFINDAYGGTSTADRNLYVDGVSYNGTKTVQSAAFYGAGSQSFSETDGTAMPSAVTGVGSDTLVLNVSEDAYKGDAQFTVSVNGKALGGTFTATAPHASGASQAFIFNGDFGAGQHAVAVNFLNDAYAGTPSTDRNLYVNGISYNGTNTAQSAALMGQGPKAFAVSGGTTPSVTETGDHGSLQKNLTQTGTYNVGGDTFVLSSGNTASVTLGTGASQLKFLGANSVTLTGGAGQAIVTADAGSNRFVAGTGSLDVTGGGGKAGYVFHANSGLLTLEDFSLAKGDTLSVDKALQGSLQQASDGQGGTMLTFGTAGHGIDVHGIAALPSSNILWA